MTSPIIDLRDQVQGVIAQMTQAWAAGSGSDFAAPFTAHALFVAFDGSTLQGPAQIAAFHQDAFSTHLRGTRLQVNIEYVRTLGDQVVLVLTRGGILRDGADRGELIGASVQTLVMRSLDTRLEVESFHNTRDRPIRGPEAAKVWRDFDAAWNGLS